MVLGDLFLQPEDPPGASLRSSRSADSGHRSLQASGLRAGFNRAAPKTARRRQPEGIDGRQPRPEGNRTGLSQAERFSEIVLVDNGSSDTTAEIASGFGITVLHEPERGYGAACLRGLAHLQNSIPADTLQSGLIAFMDADYSDYPEDIWKLVEALEAAGADLCIGSRLALEDSRKAVPPVARFGNAFACFWIWLFYKQRFTDLGPLRVLRAGCLETLSMSDRTWGWTLEMQLKACEKGLKCIEVPVRYRSRGAGKSKISQSLTGATRAASKILYVLGRHFLLKLLERLNFGSDNS